jgi:sec-independent protein translocase protein TatB
MFTVSPEHIVILLLVALFVLGPERLPTAAAWLGRAIRQVREYADDTRTQLRSELGEDYDRFREPLEQLSSLRNFNARSAVTNYLFDDTATPAFAEPFPHRANGSDKPRGEVPPPRLNPGEEPPFDSEAT